MNKLKKLEKEINNSSNVRTIDNLNLSFFDDVCKTLSKNNFTKGSIMMFGNETFCKDFSSLLTEVNAGGVYYGNFTSTPTSYIVEMSCSRGSYDFCLIPRFDLKDVSVFIPVTEEINYKLLFNVYYEKERP